MHVYLLTPSWQVPLCLQGCEAHSSISRRNKNKKQKKTKTEKQKQKQKEKKKKKNNKKQKQKNKNKNKKTRILPKSMSILFKRDKTAFFRS